MYNKKKKNCWKNDCFYYLMNIALLLFLTNSGIAWKLIRTNISSDYSEPYCASEIKNILSFNLLLNTQYSQWLFGGHIQW